MSEQQKIESIERSNRFYWRGSRSLSQSSVRSLDRSALNNLYDPLKKEPYNQQLLPSDRQLDPLPGSLQPQLKSSDTEHHTLPQLQAQDTQNQDSHPITIEIEVDYAQIESTGGFDRPTHLFEREEKLA
jgi:hypothetical protein